MTSANPVFPTWFKQYNTCKIALIESGIVKIPRAPVSDAKAQGYYRDL